MYWVQKILKQSLLILRWGSWAFMINPFPPRVSPKSSFPLRWEMTKPFCLVPSASHLKPRVSSVMSSFSPLPHFSRVGDTPLRTLLSFFLTIFDSKTVELKHCSRETLDFHSFPFFFQLLFSNLFIITIYYFRIFWKCISNFLESWTGHVEQRKS